MPISPAQPRLYTWINLRYMKTSEPAPGPGFTSVLQEGAAQRFQITLVAAAGVSAALAIILGFADLLHLPYRDEHGIVGWVSSHRYPKYQDLLLYFSCLGLAVLLVFFVYALWRLSSLLLSRLLSHSLEATHTLTALGTLPIHLVWLRLDWLSERPRRWLFAIFCLSALLTLGLTLLDRKFQFSRRLWLPRLPPPQSGSGIWARLRSNTWYRILAWYVMPLLVFAALYQGPLGGAVDLLHEGERLAPLNQLQHNGLPYADIYVQHGLFFNVYAGYIATVLFEPTLAAVRLMDGLLKPLGAVAMYLLAMTVLRSQLPGAIALVLVVATWPNWVSPRITLGVLAIALIMGAIHGTYNLQVLRQAKSGLFAVLSHGKSIVSAGIFTTLAFCYSVDIGVFTFAAIGSLLFGVGFLQPGLLPHRRGLPLGLYFVGVILAGIPVLIYFYINDGLSHLVRNVYEQLAFHSGIWGLPYARLSSAFDGLLSHGSVLTPWSLLATKGLNWFFPPMFFMASAAYLVYRWICGRFWNSPGCLRYTLAVLAALFFFITALGRASSNHLVFGSVLFYVPLFIAIEHAVVWLWRGVSASAAGALNRLWSLWLLAPIVFAMAYVGVYADPVFGLQYFSRNLTQMHLLKAPAALRSDGVPREQRRHMRQVADYIHRNTTEHETLFDFSNQPGYLYFADRPSATRYFMVSYAGSADQQYQVIQDLERHRTPLVIYKTGRRDKIDGLKNSVRHPLIANYLHTHYGKSAVVDGVTFLMRSQLP